MKEFLKVCTFWLFSFPLCNIFLSLLRPTLLSAVINIVIQWFFPIIDLKWMLQERS